jgi:hypothetical protein
MSGRKSSDETGWAPPLPARPTMEPRDSGRRLFPGEPDDFRAAGTEVLAVDGDGGELPQHLVLQFVADEFEFAHLADDDFHLAFREMFEDLRGAVRPEHAQQHGELLRARQFGRRAGGGVFGFRGGGHRLLALLRLAHPGADRLRHVVRVLADELVQHLDGDRIGITGTQAAPRGRPSRGARRAGCCPPACS